MTTHVERQGAFIVTGPVARVFPLFTPAGETLWAADWEPEYLHPPGGETVEGMVFRTRHGGEITLWGCVRWDPAGHHVRYARVSPSSRFGFVDVACRALPPGRTEVEVSYTFTAVSPAGSAYLEAFTDAAFTKMLQEWQAQIGQWLGEHPAA
jgi:hypothetical protein